MGSTDWDLEVRGTSPYYAYSVMSMKGDGSPGPAFQRATAVGALLWEDAPVKFLFCHANESLWDLHKHQHRTGIPVLSTLKVDITESQSQ